jgi:hypothetical protein
VTPGRHVNVTASPSMSEAIRKDIKKAVVDAVAARLASYRAKGFSLTPSAAPDTLQAVHKEQEPTTPTVPSAPYPFDPPFDRNADNASVEIAGSYAIAVSIFESATATANSD